MPIDPNFWHARWREDDVPWHRDVPNARLMAHLQRLELSPGAQVLVPLCGKSADMRWLLERGQRVLGVELSPLAAAAFFSEHGLPVRERAAGAFRLFEGPRIRILCGDVFDLERTHLAAVDAVYDRAALVALDSPDRERYAQRLCALLPGGVRQLVLTLEYDTARMQGPPFSVPTAEVSRLYASHYAVTELASEEIIDEEPRLRERGLAALTEHVLLLDAPGSTATGPAV